jgi:hypothetical protein
LPAGPPNQTEAALAQFTQRLKSFRPTATVLEAEIAKVGPLGCWGRGLARGQGRLGPGLLGVVGAMNPRAAAEAGRTLGLGVRQCTALQPYN